MKNKFFILTALFCVLSFSIIGCGKKNDKETNLADFIVEVAEGKDPIVLQITDPQIMNPEFYTAEGTPEELCYRYIRETVENTKPDLIIVTGDLVYGKFDPKGESWTEFIGVMESFGIPWSPVMGNHEPECEMGIDWQCEQLEKAENCLFKQRDLTGNGNYSVGIKQGKKLNRVFYMLDSNGAIAASEKSKQNGHTFTLGVGFQSNQIEWYTDSITKLKQEYPSVKLSFAYHIPQNAFQQAYKKYGFGSIQNGYEPVNIDKLENKSEGDFGWIVNGKTPWDYGDTVFNGMKSLGVDSVFVGHEHRNSLSVVVDGIRFQFGQKSSRYDSHNKVDEEGNLSDAEDSSPLIGGTVIPLSKTDGSIRDPYIYLC